MQEPPQSPLEFSGSETQTKLTDKQVYRLSLEAKEPQDERFKEYYFLNREFDFG